MILINGNIDVTVIEVVEGQVPVSGNILDQLFEYYHVQTAIMVGWSSPTSGRNALRLVEANTMGQDLYCRILAIVVVGLAKLGADHVVASDRGVVQ